MAKNNDNFHSNSFGQIIAKLAGSNAISHVITACCLPLLTRLYSPESFGAFALYVSIVSVLAVAACGRYDIAIALPERDDDATSLVFVAFITSIIFSTCAMVVMIVTRYFWPEITTPFGEWIALAPLGIMLFGAFSIGQNWNIRQKQFGKVASTTFIQSLVLNVTQLVSGVMGVGAAGLISGHIAKSASGAVILLASVARNASALKHNASRANAWTRMKNIGYEYRRFPTLSTLEALANQAAVHLPILIMSQFVSASEIGYLMLGVTIMQAPMAVIGSSISQLFLSQAPAAYRDGELFDFTRTTFIRLAKIFILPIAFVAVIAPFAVPYVFGEKWAAAGWLITWMAPWYMLQSLASPISMVLHVTSHGKTALGMQIAGLAIRVLAIIICYKTASDWILESYAVSGAIVYALFLGTIYWSLTHAHDENINEI